MNKKIFIITCVALFLSQCKEDSVEAPTFITPSQIPPGGLKVVDVPQFVCFGFDDNSYSGYPGSISDGGMEWALNIFNQKLNANGTPCYAAFYCASKFIDSAEDNIDNDSLLKESWRKAYLLGNEIGLHTHTHPHGSNVEWDKNPPIWNNLMNKTAWKDELLQNMDFLTKPYSPSSLPTSQWGPGINRADIVGFRAPFLEFNNATFEALLEHQLLYDCSVEEGFQSQQDGTNFYWPYQLDNGSPISDTTFSDQFSKRDIIGSYPGLWEMPAYCVFAPDDANCKKYGLKSGFRDELKKRVDYFEPENGKITGFDWNLWAEFKMTALEVEAILKYTLDLRLLGNRAPFLIGLHSDIYCNLYKKHNDDDNQIIENYKNSQKAIENFIDYALNKKEVRIVSPKAVIAWMKNPRPLK